jgi:spermidine synthase
MNRQTWKVALFLFGSGLCALIYQTAWMRELRLIFGGSTAASAAVLAIFMGGLGLGSYLLGPKADRHPRPLEFYANLELCIAGSAALSPMLVWLAGVLYTAVGGTPELGLVAGTVVRLVLATLVLCVPTFLMGGTLPAAARAVEMDDDAGRRSLALLYGANTLGAVLGTALSTFTMLELFGTQKTLWLACLVNALVAVLARSAARSKPKQALEPEAEREPTDAVESALPREPATAPAIASGESPAFILTASALVGFAFFLMELVWYRMLGPLLGGSTFTFGLILAVALFGVGLGGAAYAILRGGARATRTGFAITCALEAVCLAVPFALGDQLAVTAALLRPLGAVGFHGYVLAWTAMASIVVLPAAFVAGIQFPMLIALLGTGRRDVGRHVGLAYAFNTMGAIAGAVVGGFGILPLLTAPGAWRVVVGLLAALGLVAAAPAIRLVANRPAALTAAGAAVVAVALVCTTGPTAAWRHSPIGAGRADLTSMSANQIRGWLSWRRRTTHWEAEGVESSVAIIAESGAAFAVNGKIDGNARADAGTQIMGGVLLGLLHPQPKSAFVVGLGTGSTAGWLGLVPTMERVDVAELEPAILEVARLCAPVNGNVLANPKVDVFTGDAREVLLTTRRRFDVIFSEPSNPYRAGVAGLFTREFYQAASGRLAEGGIFGQWLQAYEVDSRTVRTTIATLASVFPSVEIWQTEGGDLLLVGTNRPITYDVPALRARIAEEPFRSALFNAWRATDLEAVLAHHVARSSLTHAIAQQVGPNINTDDRNLVEFAFARSVGSRRNFDESDLWNTAIARGEDRPEVRGGAVDWERVADARISMYAPEGHNAPIRNHATADRYQRAVALAEYTGGRLGSALDAWRRQPREPADPVELALLAECVADTGDEAAAVLIERLRTFQPTEADAVLGRLRWRQGRVSEAVTAFEAAFIAYRSDPWPIPALMERALDVAVDIAARDKTGTDARRLFQAVDAPFSVLLLQERRLVSRFKIAGSLDAGKYDTYTPVALAPFEPNVLWERDFLTVRMACYTATGNALADQAARDLNEFLGYEPLPFEAGLLPR